MDTQKACQSPTYKNLKTKVTGSPKEIKDKLRKDYKNKIHSSRNMLLNKFRNIATGIDIHQTLTQIYNDTFQFSMNGLLYDSEEMEVLEQIKKELIQDEVDWWLEEYEKSHMDNIDWSSLQQEENVICPICQKNNFSLESTGVLSCVCCKISLNVTKSLSEIKASIYDCTAMHSNRCTSDGHFTVISEDQYTHLYFLCDLCAEMNLVI